jgi:HEAT repeat protein
MPTKKTFAVLTLAGLLAAATALAQTPYDEGQKALRDQRWMDAVDQFELAIKSDDGQADAALYWSAYAYFKAGRRNEAERELRQLERNHPDSRWVKESQSLRLEYQDSAELLTSPDAALDDDLKIFALAQLMERDPERALPLVLELMKTTESEKVRQDALFVLAVSETPAARQELANYARDGSDPEMQRHAIQMLGTMDATAELEALYPTLKTRGSKVAVIEAFGIAGDSARLSQVLETETDPELRRAAIHGIAMEDNAEAAELLRSIYESADSSEEKSAVLESLTMLEEAEAVALEVLRNESDPELQRQAIQVLGIMDATDELDDLYTSLEDREARLTVIEAMAIAEDSEGLFDILLSEQDTELRAAAIQGLAMNGGSKEADYLVELYPEATQVEKQAVIESMLIMDDAENLLKLLQQESDPELKREMLQLLTTMDSEASDDYLFEMLENKG